MNDLRFSGETPSKYKSEIFPITPQPIYRKVNQSDLLNNISNISTEYSMREESRIINNKNLSHSENENSADLSNVAKPKPLTLKKSSFSLCKDFLNSKNFEEMKINDIGIFSGLRINHKNSNTGNFNLNSDDAYKNNVKIEEENNSKENIMKNANQDNYNSNFTKKSSLFTCYIKNLDNAESRIENNKNFNNLNDLNNFSFNQINNKIESIKSDFSKNKNNNNFNNNDKNGIYFDKNFQNLGTQKNKSFSNEINENKNNNNYSSELNAKKDDKDDKDELRFIKHKNFFVNELSDNENSKNTLVENGKFFNNYLKRNNSDNSKQDHFNSDSQIINKSSNLIKSTCYNSISNKKNFNNIRSVNSNFQRIKENPREKSYNINNITNIYINFENDNQNNFNNQNSADDSLFRYQNNNLSYLPLIKNNNNNNLNNQSTNKTDNNLISKSMNSSPNLNYLNMNKNLIHFEKANEKFVCSNTGLSNIPISELFQKEKIFRKIFNICNLYICKNRVKKLSNNSLDIYNIELVEPLFKNNFRSLTVEKKNKNTKKLNFEINDISLFQSEQLIWQQIQNKINDLFNEILDIQKKYLTKASGYISKKQVLICSDYISLINYFIERLTVINPKNYQVIEEEVEDLEIASNEDTEYKKENNINNNEKESLSNHCSSYLIDNNSNFNEDNNIGYAKLFCKKNKIIINNSDDKINFVNSDFIDNDNFSSNLELNDLNQMNITNDYSNLKTEKKRKNSAFISNNEKILQRKISKTSESKSTNNIPMRLQIKNLSDSYDSDLDQDCFSSLENSNSQNNSKSSKAHNKKTNSKTVKLLSNHKSFKNEFSSVNNDNKEIYKCDHCEAFYFTGQALGGHMSRTHPNLSLKYKMKKVVRDRRENQRNVLTEARKELLIKYNLDYEDMKNDKIKKHILKSFIKEHSLQYKEIVKKLKKIHK